MRLLVIPLIILIQQSSAAFLSVNAKLEAKFSCGLYEEYRSCGPNCPYTCDTVKDNICCDVKCVSGCFCKDGYMLLSKNGPKKCVPITTCPKPGILMFQESTLSVLESSNIIRVVVIRVNGSYGEVSVRWRIVFKGGLSYPEYVGRSGRLVFPDGVVRQVIEIPVYDNNNRGQDITFSVELYGATNKVEINSRQALSMLTIKDDDMKPGYLEFEFPDYTIRENEQKRMVCVKRYDGLDGELKIKYKTISSSAMAGHDFKPITGELVFREGVDVQHIMIPIINDDIREPEKVFEVEIFDPVSEFGMINFRGMGSRKRAVVKIIDDDMKPGWFQLEKTNYEVSESIGLLRIGVLRVGGTDGQIKLRYKTVIKSAFAQTDFVPVEGVLIFEENETKKYIEIQIVDNDAREPTETFEVLLFEPAAGPGVINFRNGGFQQSVIVSILDNDMKPGYFELEKSSFNIRENVGILKIGVFRRGGTDGQIRVRYMTVIKTAQITKDFIPVNGDLVFEEGETKKFIDIVIIDDDVREPTKFFEFKLIDPTPGMGVINFRGLGSLNTALVAITDDDMKPGYLEFEYPNYTVQENQSKRMVCVKRYGGTDGELRVKYKTIGASAVADKDFVSVVGDLIFKEGVDTQHILIPIVDDEIREPDKIFEIEIFDPTAEASVINFRGLGSKIRTVIRIIDDDMTPGYFEIEKGNYVISEGIGTLRIAVVRVGGTDGQIRVHYRTIVKTALINSDFFPVEGELVYEEGEKIKHIGIQIIDDDIREPTKTFMVELFDPAPGSGVINFRGLGSQLTTLVTINDDDMKPGFLLFEFPSYTTQENARNKKVCVKRIEGTDGELNVKYKTISGTAVVSKDFIAISGELVFREGVSLQCIIIPIINNDVRQPDRTFEIEIFDPAPGFGVINFRGLGSTRRSVIKIIDDDMSPGVFELEQTAYSVLESVGVIKVGVLRVGGSDGQIKIRYQTIQKTAQPSVDFLPVVGELVFEEGVIKKYIEVNIVNDDLREQPEMFEIQILDPAAGDGVINFRGLGRKRTTLITILDDDMKPGYLEMEKASITVAEEVGTVHVTVVRLGGSDGELKTKYRFVGISAQSLVDFMAQPGELIFHDGETRKTIPITILDDNIRETIETFRVELFDPWTPTGGMIFRKHQTIIFTQVVIIDNDMHPGVVVMEKASITVTENVGVAQINVIRTGGSDGNLVVKYHTVDGTAMHGIDYIDTEGEVVFGDGETRKIISIRILNDNIKEPVKSFRVELIGLQSRQLGSETTTSISIIDDDKTPGIFEFALSRVTVAEEQPKLLVTILRKEGTDGSVTLQWRTKDLTATEGLDYKSTRGVITFNEGETQKIISIDIIDDNLKENDEDFLIGLFNPTNGGKLGPTSTIIVTIKDNDDHHIEAKSPLPDIEIFFVRTSVRVKRSMGKARLHVRREGDHLLPVTIFLITKDGSAKGGIDYRRTRGEITFLEKEIELTLEFRLLPSNEPGEDKSFFVEISRPSRGKILPTGSVATVIIENDIPKSVGRKLEVSGGGSYETSGGISGGVNYESSGGMSGGVKEQSWSVSSSYEYRGGHGLLVPSPPPVAHQVKPFIPQQPPQNAGQGTIPKCPTGMTFKLCAPTCPKTCQTMNNPVKSCDKKCINACFCPDGYVIDNLTSLKCILPKDCASFKSSSVISASAAIGVSSALGSSSAVGSSAAGIGGLLGGVNVGGLLGG